MSLVISVIVAFLLPPVSAWGWGQLFRLWVPRWPRTQWDVLTGWVVSAAFGLGYGDLHPDWPWAAGSGASLTAAWLVIWWRRRKRRRALALLGAKSRALIAAMVRTMRRSRRPSRVLRPHPVPS